MKKQKERKGQKEVVKRAGDYKVTNWAQYNAALKARGSLQIWIDEEVLASWHDTARLNAGKLGARYVYPNIVIEFILRLGMVFHQRLRQTEGLVESIMNLLGLDLSVPNYSTLSRRRTHLEISLGKNFVPKDATDMVIDSTGLKFYGEGEWKVKKHGAGKHRMWRKLHLGAGTDGEIRVSLLTDNSKTDAAVLPNLLSQERIRGTAITDCYADGAYDILVVYEHLVAAGVTSTGVHIPPQRNAKIQFHGNIKAPPHARDENLRAIRKTSRSGWKQRSGYHSRSLSETQMYRYKHIVGDRVSAQTEPSQQAETIIGLDILNRMARLGMPCSTWQQKPSISSKARAISGFGVTT